MAQAQGRLGAAAAVLAAVAAGLLLVSGGESTVPRTPPALPGEPPPFLGTAVVGGGGLSAAIDAYGDVVDLRPSPAGPALIDDPSDRQAAGTVPADTGIVPRLRIDGGPALPMWRADSVSQRYLPGANVVRTVARFGRVRIAITDAASGAYLGRLVEVEAPAGVRAVPQLAMNVEPGADCRRERRPRAIAMLCEVPERPSPDAEKTDSPGIAEPRSSPLGKVDALIRSTTIADRAWLAKARPLGGSAPAWARGMYRRSLLTLRALTGTRTGAVAAGARDGWAYVWPRDAASAALALSAAGYRDEARRIAQFLTGLDLAAAARFEGNGAPVPGRAAQGDAAGWAAVAARATGIPYRPSRFAWRNRADYQEGEPGDYLANAIAATADVSEFVPPMWWENSDTPSGLVRESGDPASGLDSAAAWAVRPFSIPSLYPAVRQTLRRLVARQTRFGITPGEAWSGGTDPWTAPTAWTAWSLAALANSDRSAGRHALALGERRQALRLLADLRRAATPAGALPERVDARTGVPRSTTPLAWSHAFAVLALRELWPSR
jgi:glucoamylase